ncbi:MAG: hemolysin III family protein [Anaerolineaceae bacterium]
MTEKFRDPVSGLMHLAAAILALVGLIVLLLLGQENIEKQISLLIYGLSLVAMLSASAIYHLVKATPGVELFLRKMDHSAIYLLIAGTYTPVCLFFFSGFYRWGLLGIIWGMALIGILVKLFVINAPRWTTAGIYLIMGWLAVFGLKEMLSTMPAGALIWLLAGGIFYSVGAVIYITRKMDFFPGVFGFHEVWHIFVVLGCLSHFILVARYIAAVPLAS